jgi:hypothetical protein
MNYTKGEIKNCGFDSSGRIVLRVDPGLVTKCAAAPAMYEALKLFIERMGNEYKYPIELELPRVWAMKALADAEGK